MGLVADDKQVSYRIYLVAFAIVVMAILVSIKLTNIQWVEGDYYRELARQRSVKDFTIPANRGNVYSADGSLLATSIPNYVIRFDAVAPKDEDFEEYLTGLSDSLSVMLGKPSNHYYHELRKARKTKDRYHLITKGLTFRCLGWVLLKAGLLPNKKQCANTL